MGVDEKLKAKARTYKTTNNQPPAYKDHGLTGNRFAFPLPQETKAPVRARAVRKQKGIAGY